MGCLGLLGGVVARRGFNMKMALGGKTPEQKKVIKYFAATGWRQALFGLKDAGFDKILAAKRSSFNTKTMALAKIGLDEDQLREIPEVNLEGFQDYELMNKIGKDRKWRSAKYAVTHVFFSSTQVYMYQLIFNLDSNDKKERTEEYFYKDITNVSTTRENLETIFPSGCLSSVKKETVTIQRFALIVPGDKFSCDTQQDIERSVQGMKAKLREKKNG